jgi:hypothetical protein
MAQGMNHDPFTSQTGVANRMAEAAFEAMLDGFAVLVDDVRDAMQEVGVPASATGT